MTDRQFHSAILTCRTLMSRLKERTSVLQEQLNAVSRLIGVLEEESEYLTDYMMDVMDQTDTDTDSCTPDEELPFR